MSVLIKIPDSIGNAQQLPAKVHLARWISFQGILWVAVARFVANKKQQKVSI